MSDIERAIKYIKNILPYAKPGEEYESFHTALIALQEQDERSKPLEWRKYSYDEWICPHCGYDKYCDTLDGGVLPPFCEECGRPLKVGDGND